MSWVTTLVEVARNYGYSTVHFCEHELNLPTEIGVEFRNGGFTPEGLVLANTKASHIVSHFSKESLEALDKAIKTWIATHRTRE